MNVAAQPLALRTISPTRVELENLLATRQAGITVLAGEHAEQLRPTAEDVAVAHEVHVQCDLGESEICLSVDASWMSKFVPDGFADFTVSELPQPLGLALAELGLSPLIEAVGTLFAAPMSLKRVIKEAPAAETILALRLVGDMSTPPTVQIFLDSGTEQALIDVLRRAPSRADPPIAAVIPLSVSACIGSQGLTREELHDLVPGAVVLFETPPTWPKVTVLLGETMRPFGAGTLDDRVLTLDSILGRAMASSEDDADIPEEGPPEEPNESLSDEAAEEPSEPTAEENFEPGDDVSIEGLEVRLDFVAGRKTLTVSEIQSLAPGATITLDAPASQAVTIYASGRRLGTGELVDIGGQLGVRISKLNGAGNG